MKLRLFTITYNAMPLLAWHLPVLQRLDLDWHWIISHGPSVSHSDYDRDQVPGLSTDGTTEYLQSIRRHPRVTILERPAWQNRTAQANACLDQIGQHCVLVQLDSDEFWTDSQLRRIVWLFRISEDLGKADFYYRHFVGPNIIVLGENGWGAHRGQRRAWRFRPGQRFANHETPDLPVEPLRLACASETRAYGLVFDHLSYVFASQLEYKERTYGYRGAVAQWRALQANDDWPIQDLQQWLPWIGRPGVKADLLFHPEYIPPMSETDKHRHLVIEHCQGNGVDLGSSGEPIVPWAIQVDLPKAEYRNYNTTRPEANIHWRGDALNLPFKAGTLDWVHSSHLIEDYKDWNQPLDEWDRVLKPGGFLIISVPDHARFRAAVARGQGDNLSHRHESYVGELTKCLKARYDVLRDDFVNDDPNEYSILFVGKKK